MLFKDILLPAILDTLYMVTVSTVFAVILGFISAVLLIISGPKGLRPNLIIYKSLNLVINVLRSFPFIILMISIFPVTKFIVGTTIGTNAAIVPLTLGAAPFAARIIESALLEVDYGIIEAAKSFGAKTHQIIFKVMVKEAMPSIVLGVTLTVINIIGYSAMAGTIGGGGLGDVAVKYGYYRFKTNIMIYTVIILIVIVIFTLSGCGAKKEDAASEKKVIKVGASPVPHKEILEVVKPLLAKEGYTLEIVEFTDYVTPNTALAEGQLDANFFQHVPYLQSFAAERKLDLDYTVKVHIEPMGLYSDKYKNLSELKDGAEIAIPNDPTNGARALRILDAAVINSNFAIEAKLNPTKDSLAIESKNSPYANVLAVRKEDKTKPYIEALSKALNSPEVKKFIEEKYEGNIVPAF